MSPGHHVDPRPFAAALAAFAVLTAAYGTESVAEGPRPRLEIASPMIDLGEIPEGEEAQAVFELTNSGDAQLAILSAKPS